MFALEDFEADADGSRQNPIGGNGVGDSDCQDPGQSVVGSPKDHKDDQPDAEDAQAHNQQTPDQAYQRPHHQGQHSKTTEWGLTRGADCSVRVTSKMFAKLS